MLTIEVLKEYGADTDKALERCVNNEGFYFKLIDMAIADANFGKLGEAIEANDLEAGFSASHALKGILANLELTPILKEVCEIVEPFRRKEEGFAYAEQYERIMEKREELLELMQ